MLIRKDNILCIQYQAREILIRTRYFTVSCLVLAGLKNTIYLPWTISLSEHKTNKDAEVYFHKANFLFVVAYFMNIQFVLVVFET